jgi:hypothetical protein
MDYVQNAPRLSQWQVGHWLPDKPWPLESINMSRVRDLTAPMHLGLKACPLCPMSNQGSPEALLKLQMAPRLIIWMSLDSKKKEPRYICLSEAKASHSQKIWAKVSSITPHSYTMDCPAVLIGKDATSGCYDQ